MEHVKINPQESSYFKKMLYTLLFFNVLTLIVAVVLLGSQQQLYRKISDDSLLRSIQQREVLSELSCGKKPSASKLNE